MNRKNLIPLVGIAFAVAVISTWIFYGLVAGRFEQAASATARTVIVAKRPLAAGAAVGADDLRSITWSGADAPDGAFAVASQVVGGRVISAIGENEPLTRTAVEVHGGEARGAVPVGMRAVSLRVGDSLGLMPLVGRGSLVDIQAVSTAREGTVSVRTILERISVLNVQKPGEGGIGKNEPAVVTVLVDHADADRLAYADSAGRIRLALRNPAEGMNGTPIGSVPAVPKLQSIPIAPTTPSQAAVVAPPSFANLSIDVSLLTATTAGESGIRAGEAPALPVKGRWSGVTNGGMAFVDGEMQGYRVRVALRGAHVRGDRYEAVVEPEISWPGATATEARRLSQNISWKPNEKIVVRGLSTPDGTPAVIVVAASTRGAGRER